MAESPLRLIKRWQPMLPKSRILEIPRGLRGIYVLYKHHAPTDTYNVVYVGMSRGGKNGHILRRIGTHRKYKGPLWTHCSVYEIWENVRDTEIEELEGLFRQIYRTDARANKLNKQQRYKKLLEVPKIIKKKEKKAL